MLDRRGFLGLGVAGALSGLSAAAPPQRLLFIHGRDQQGQDPAALKGQWLDALQEGARKLGRSLPGSLDVALPFYGDKLDSFVRDFDVPLTSDVRTRGGAPDEEFLRFQAEMGEAFRTAAGITDAQVDAEYGPNPKPRGPLNWEWVQAVLRALDKHGDGLNATTLETFTRDVFLYTRRAGVRDEIDGIVARTLSEEPTLVVAHSLGSVVAYSVLGKDLRNLRVPLLVTVGSPLGVRAIREQFRPLRHPRPVGSWWNAFDPRDVVALYPLDAANFPIDPAVENVGSVKNRVSDRHGVVGYLEDPAVAKRILDAMSGV